METVGSLIDKLSINELKIYHMNELNILKMQRKDLSEELQTLMDDVLSGRKELKLYRQMKMYNEKKFKD